MKYLEYLKLYQEPKINRYIGNNFFPMYDWTHATMNHPRYTLSDFKNPDDPGVIALKYRFDQHEKQITHEWLHWIIILTHLFKVIFLSNWKPILISSAIYFVIGMFTINSGFLGVTVYLLAFLIDKIAYALFRAKDMFAYHLSIAIDFIYNNYPNYKSLIEDKTLDTTVLYKNLMISHFFQKTIPLIVFGIFMGILVTSFFILLTSINYNGTIKTIIWLLSVIFLFNKYSNFGYFKLTMFIRNLIASPNRTLWNNMK